MMSRFVRSSIPLGVAGPHLSLKYPPIFGKLPITCSESFVFTDELAIFCSA
jgi:hypothetical protein